MENAIIPLFLTIFVIFFLTKPSNLKKTIINGKVVYIKDKLDTPTPHIKVSESTIDFGYYLLLPFKIIWNIFIFIISITLTIMWLSFLFGSIIGIVLLLIFYKDGFLLPLIIMNFIIPLRR